MMTEVKWKSETRIIPGHGVAERGGTILLPDLLAAKFIEQGEAELPTQAKKSTKEIEQ